MRATCVFILVMAAGTAGSQTATPTPEEVAANTAKAIADMRKAQAEAELAALKARLGGDVTVPYTGAITAGANTGTVEGYILAADAVKGAARAIVERVMKKKPAAVVLMASAEIPSFNSLISFRLSSTVFEEAFQDAKNAQIELDKLSPPGTKPPSLPRPAAAPVAAALLGADALNKMLGFFRSDYSMNGMNIEFDDSILLHALAGELATHDIDTVLPIQYNHDALDTDKSPVLKSFRSIAEKRAEAQWRSIAAEKAYNDADTQAKAATTLKKEWEEFVRRHKEVWDKWKGLNPLFESQFAKLGIPDEKGILPISLIIKEAAIKDALQKPGAQLLIAKSQKSGGSYYTKKNIWTSLGTMPFYAAGGTVASFVQFDGPTGKVLAAGAIPIHGGYKRIDKIEKNFRPPPETP